MKKISFLAIIAAVLCLVSCGPKETKAPLAGTTDYVLFNLSDTPESFGVKNLQDEVVLPDVYDKIEFVSGFFVVQQGANYKVLTTDGKEVMQNGQAITYNAQSGCFEGKNGRTLKVYFPQEKGLIDNVEAYLIDANGLVQVQQAGKHGVYNKQGAVVIPVENEMLLLDGEKYVTLNSKNAKKPMLKDGKITYWSRVKITAYDKDGKEAKAPTLTQVKKLVK